MPDAHKNFAYSLIATAPSPATSGTSCVVTAGTGTKFPAAPFNATVWPVGAQPSTANAEIVRVTAVSTDTLTITRAQESSSARTVIVGDQIAATITAKTLTDAETGRWQQRITGLGLITESFPGNLIVGNNTPTSQDAYFVGLGLLAGDIITNVVVNVGNAGTSVTAVYVGLYDSTAARVAVSTDQKALFGGAAGTPVVVPLSAPYTVPTTGFYYASILQVATTCHQLSRASAVTGASFKVGSGGWTTAIQTGQATLPTNATLATATINPWMALS